MDGNGLSILFLDKTYSCKTLFACNLQKMQKTTMIVISCDRLYFNNVQ